METDSRSHLNTSYNDAVGKIRWLLVFYKKLIGIKNKNKNGITKEAGYGNFQFALLPFFFFRKEKNKEKAGKITKEVYQNEIIWVQIM